jgi:hypothetical protein
MLTNNFLKISPLVDVKVISETLTRMGVASNQKKILWPSCYLYYDSPSFYLIHFKQAFSLIKENYYDNLSQEDLIRRNAIAWCLKRWQLIDVDDKLIEDHGSHIFTITHEDKKNWTVQHKINMSEIRNGNII